MAIIKRIKAALGRFYLRFYSDINALGIIAVHYAYPVTGFLALLVIYLITADNSQKREKQFRTAREERFNYGITHKSIMFQMDKLDSSMAFVGISRLSWTTKGHYIRDGTRYTITVERSALIDQSDRKATELIA